ncbi:MAG: hypothetical protein ABIT83_02510 [Massilia sp.]
MQALFHLPVQMFDKEADSHYNGFRDDGPRTAAKLPGAMSSWEDDLDFADHDIEEKSNVDK